MRGSIRCVVLGVLAVAAWHHFGIWPDAAPLLRPAATGGWGALSFALAAVIDTDRAG